MIKKFSKEKGDNILLYVVLSLLVFSIFVVFGYLTYIFGAAILAFTFYPFYLKVLKHVKKPVFAGLLCTLLVLVLLVLPLVGIGFFVFSSGGINYEHLERSAVMASSTIKEYTGMSIDLTKYLASAKEATVSYFFSNTTSLLTQTVDVLVGIFLLLVGFFYFLVDGVDIAESIKKFTPIQSSRKDYLMAKLHVTTKSILIGTFLTAIAQGMIAGVSYFLFGVSNAALWTLLTMFGALLPLVGSALVWLPLSLFKFLEGDVYAGMGLLLYNILLTSTIDNIIRPALVPEKANIHPLLIIAGVLGGTKALGFWGVIAGPLILALFVASAKAYAYQETTLKHKVRKINEPDPNPVNRVVESVSKKLRGKKDKH